MTCHTVPNVAEPQKKRKEQWRRQKYLGSGAFGTVFLEECIGVVGDVEAGSEDNTGKLRAVKQIRKARNQTTLSKQSVRELNSLVFFSNPAVSIALKLFRSRDFEAVRRNQPSLLYLLILEKYEYEFVKSFGWYENPSTLFVAMEYCPLGDMDSYLLDHGPVPETDGRYISRQISVASSPCTPTITSIEISSPPTLS